MTMFNGFTQQTQDFLWGLLLNNERPWFEAHRADYMQHLWVPFKELALDTLEEMQRRFPDLQLNLHVSRIYRDARRLFGRGPYKEHLWFSIGRTAKTDCNPSFWFQLGAEGWGYGLGLFGQRPDEMDNYRKSIAADPAGFLRMVRKIEADGRFVLTGDSYKRPKGDVGPELSGWYNKKYVCLEHMEDFEGALLTPALPKVMAEGFTALVPMYLHLCGCVPEC